MTVEVKQILKPKSVETAEDDMPDRLKSSDISSEIDFLKRIKLKAQILQGAGVLSAEDAVLKYKRKGFRGHVYLMPCGGVESLYNMNAKNVAIAAMNRGYRYSDRLQVPLFKNEWGT